jgi:hypothetical protein
MRPGTDLRARWRNSWDHQLNKCQIPRAAKLRVFEEVLKSQLQPVKIR